MTNLKIGMLAAVATALASTSAYSAGFDRGTADTDILFEKGTVSRTGITIVAPDQDITSIGGGPSGGYDTPSYIIPSVAFKMDLTDDLACAGTFTTPFGGNNDYSSFSIGGAPFGFDPTSATGTIRSEFDTREFGLTCSYAFDAGSGRFRIIAGGFLQTLEYEQIVNPFNPFSFTLDDRAFGYRFGAAYEIPEIALRAQLMYRSSVQVDAKGEFTNIATGIVANPNATGSAEFPQSVELKLQSGVAPGWLVYGSAKWTEWSSFDVLNFNATGTPGTINFFYRDTWRLQAGVAHVFNENLSGTVNFTWDQAAGAGHAISPETYTIGAGVLYKINDNIELTLGAGYSFLKGQSQNFSEDGTGGTFTATPGIKVAEDGQALAGTFNIKIKF